MGIQVVMGFMLDLLLGDPSWFPHPVRIIGRMISCLEKLIRSFSLSKWGMKIAGVFLMVTTVSLTFFTTWGILRLIRDYSYVLYLFGATVLIYFELATRCLDREARGIYEALKSGDLLLARKRLSYIVSRDTKDLNEGEIVKATVETVAENTSDGIIAPMFYIFLGGPALGMAYKAASTLDSMVGYKDEKYIDLGWASARLDDVLNWLPARITGLLVLLAGVVWGKNAENGYRIMRRDAKKPQSPNAGFPEAAMAGILGIQLGGAGIYFGKKVKKPTLGEAERVLHLQDILDSTVIMKTTAFLALGIFYAFFTIMLY